MSGLVSLSDRIQRVQVVRELGVENVATVVDKSYRVADCRCLSRCSRWVDVFEAGVFLNRRDIVREFRAD